MKTILKIPFKLGDLVITTNAKNTVIPQDVYDALQRHKQGDWGNICEEDWESNNHGLKTGEDRMLSSYTDRKGTKFWILTEWDRSVTTVLLPEDY